jgi:hypothetical protein
MTNPRVLAALRRRLDVQALAQLRTLAVAQAEQLEALRVENESLRTELSLAEHCSDSWRYDALRFQDELCQQTGGQPGLTKAGALVVVPAVGRGS